MTTPVKKPACPGTYKQIVMDKLGESLKKGLTLHALREHMKTCRASNTFQPAHLRRTVQQLEKEGYLVRQNPQRLFRKKPLPQPKKKTAKKSKKKTAKKSKKKTAKKSKKKPTGKNAGYDSEDEPLGEVTKKKKKAVTAKKKKKNAVTAKKKKKKAVTAKKNKSTENDSDDEPIAPKEVTKKKKKAVTAKKKKKKAVKAKKNKSTENESDDEPLRVGINSDDAPTGRFVINRNTGEIREGKKKPLESIYTVARDSSGDEPLLQKNKVIETDSEDESLESKQNGTEPIRSKQTTTAKKNKGVGINSDDASTGKNAVSMVPTELYTEDSDSSRDSSSDSSGVSTSASPNSSEYSDISESDSD